MSVDVKLIEAPPLARTAFGGLPLYINRPANVTAYTAVDAVGTSAGAVLIFPDMAPAAGGNILITSASFELDITSVPAGMTSFRLWLYKALMPSAFADNGAWSLPVSDRDIYLGYLDIGTPVLSTGATILTIDTNILQKQVRLVSDKLYAYLVTAGGYTPASNSEVYKLTLSSVLL